MLKDEYGNEIKEGQDLVIVLPSGGVLKATAVGFSAGGMIVGQMRGQDGKMQPVYSAPELTVKAIFNGIPGQNMQGVFCVTKPENQRKDLQ